MTMIKEIILINVRYKFFRKRKIFW